MNSATVIWDDALINGALDLAKFIGHESLVVTGARSMGFNEESTSSAEGTRRVSTPAPVTIQGIPSGLRRLHIHVVSDLVLRFPSSNDSPCVETLVLDGGPSQPLVTLNEGRPAVLETRAVRYGVLRVTPLNKGEESYRAQSVALLTLRPDDADGIVSIGPLQVGRLELPTNCSSLVIQPLSDAECLIGTLIHHARRLTVRATRPLRITQAIERCDIQSDADIRLGSDVHEILASDVAITTKGNLLLGNGRLETAMLDCGHLALTPFRPGARPMAIDISGIATSIAAGEDSLLAGSSDSGLHTGELDLGSGAEVTGIAAHRLSLRSIESLRKASATVGLWVDPSAGKARLAFQKQAEATTPILGRHQLSQRRSALLRLAIDTEQSGHVLSIIREAEKDARRRSLARRNRERLLLGASRWATGYGERILWPLVVGALLILPLAIAQVGWGTLTRRGWWTGFGHLGRYEHILGFVLPSWSALGLPPSGGLWGVLAKTTFGLFAFSALAAARKLVRRA